MVSTKNTPNSSVSCNGEKEKRSKRPFYSSSRAGCARYSAHECRIMIGLYRDVETGWYRETSSSSLNGKKAFFFACLASGVMLGVTLNTLNVRCRDTLLIFNQHDVFCLSLSICSHMFNKF